jgi:hypothetical protein
MVSRFWKKKKTHRVGRRATIIMARRLAERKTACCLQRRVPDMTRNLRVKVPYEPLARGIIS